MYLRSSILCQYITSLLPINEQLDDDAIKMYFDKKIQAISSHLINILARLFFREQTNHNSIGKATNEN